jgi:CheY-like chemotaxis protein
MGEISEREMQRTAETGPRVLVIDDEKPILLTVATILGDAGYEVLTAADGRAGLAIFEKTAPALVLTDIIMPEQDGLGAIAEMRRARPDVRIVAMSGGGRVGNTDFLKLATKLGANAALPKPFDDTELLAVIGALLAPAPRAARRVA